MRQIFSAAGPTAVVIKGHTRCGNHRAGEVKKGKQQFEKVELGGI